LTVFPFFYERNTHANKSSVLDDFFSDSFPYQGKIIEEKNNNEQLFTEVEMNSGGYLPSRKAATYISTTLHRQ